MFSLSAAFRHEHGRERERKKEFGGGLLKEGQRGN
jgi:hypothetical protein